MEGFRRYYHDHRGGVKQGSLEDWPFVEKGLQEILRRCGNANWQPEDVKRHIREGRAGLFLSDDGFIVLELDKEPISEKPFLNVWLAWFKPNTAKALRRGLIAWLDDMTKERKCEWWQFSSPREGWVGIEPDCENYMTIWRRRP